MFQEKVNCNNVKDKKSKDFNKYKKCLDKAQNQYDNGDISLCPRGYCTAKQIFQVYPSAYAHGYAASVCKGSLNLICMAIK